MSYQSDPWDKMLAEEAKDRARKKRLSRREWWEIIYTTTILFAVCYGIIFAFQHILQ